MTQIKSKPKILIFVRHYLPGFRSGGPVQSIANLTDRFGQDFEFYVVCLAWDMGQKAFFPNVVLNEWNKSNDTKIYYSSTFPTLNLLKSLIKEVKPDVIYTNSFFDFHFSIKVVILNYFNQNLRVIVAPRGEFNPGALCLKPVKKKLYLVMAKLFNLYRGVVWHATSEKERELIQSKSFGVDENIFVASNIPAGKKISSMSDAKKEPGTLKVILPARISRMKNTLQAIRLINELTGSISLDLIGPLEDMKYWRSCEDLIAKSPENVEISYLGEKSHSEILNMLSNYHVLLLPTFGENFGHSIAEALSRGLPVITSDRTPWKSLEYFGVGFDLPLCEEGKFISALEIIRDKNNNEFCELSERCKKYFKEWEAANVHDSDYHKVFLGNIKR